MSPTESLISAIRSFDVDTVEKLSSDLEIEYGNGDHHSVLHTAVELIACGTSSLETVRFKEKSKKHLNLLHRSEEFLRIIKVLLKSGRFNMNGFAQSSQTALHIAAEKCRCRIFSSDDYKDLVNAIIELLLKNKANVNAKTSSGETLLMMASEHGCTHIVKLLLDWRDEHGAGVDLNARDIYGETALIKAAKEALVDVVELLLEHGCFDEIQDHRGFYALHAAICGPHLINNASKDFLALVGVLESGEASLGLERNAAHSLMGKNLCKRWAGNDSIQDTVSMLVTRGRADINSKDFRGNTVLDVALNSKLRINQKTVEKLKEYGATSGALPNRHLEYPTITLQYTDKLGKTPLHRLSAVFTHYSLGEKVEIFLRHLNKSPHKKEFKEMTVAKDHRGRTALHYAVMSTGIYESPTSYDILINVLNLKPTINEKDNYGRTPLHYCEDVGVYQSLVRQGANEQTRDIDGKTPRDLATLQKSEEHWRYFRFGKLQCQLNREKIDAWMIWNNPKHIYFDEFSKQICDKVRQLMNRLSDEIKKKDPRFECRPVLIGSAEDGTKIGLPDEFDFNFILTELSELCEVVPSPEAPSGFIHSKRKYNKAENRSRSQHFQSQENFDQIFNSDGYLLTLEIACSFRFLYLEVMSEPDFWKGEDFFEWHPSSESGLIYDKKHRQFNESQHHNEDLKTSTHLCSTIQLKLNRPIEGRYMFTPISLDIVPCIQLNGWWPEEALSVVDYEIKAGGCHLVFDRPQRHYPWVPFSVPFVRISFAPAESRIIKGCSAVARAAYVVGKRLLLYNDKSELTYVLKTCLLYCIEALKDCTSNSLLYEDINPAELRIFVEKLMLCFHEFYLQDFLPCYMMPSFHLPIEDYLKSKHDQLLHDSKFQYPLFAYELYSKFCTTESPEDFCPPTPEPLNEKFNRKELLRKLSINRGAMTIRRKTIRRRTVWRKTIRRQTIGRGQFGARTVRRKTIRRLLVTLLFLL